MSETPQPIATAEKPTPLDNQADSGVVEKGDVIGLYDDVGRELYEHALGYDQEQLERDAKKVKRKLDFIVLPIMMVTYALGFLDKQTLNYANAYTMQKDLNLHGSDYSWIASAVSIGWLISAYPSSLILQKFSISRLVGCFIVTWGALCMLSAATTNFGGLFAVRFIQGIAEALITPAWMMLTGILWTGDEVPLRSSMWLGVDGMASILGGLLSWGLGLTTSAIPSWKLVFLIVGSVTIFWAGVVLVYLPDGPHKGRLFSEYERVVLVWRISKNKTGVKNTTFKWAQVKEALLDEKTWLLLLSSSLYGILNGGVVNFKSALMKGFGFTGTEANLLQMPSGAFQIIGCTLFGLLAKQKNMKGASIILACVPGMAGLIGILTISHDPKYKYALVICASLQSLIAAPIAISWALPVVNVSGHTKRSTVLGLVFVFFSAGMIAGPHLFIESEALRYPTAIKGLLSCYAISIFLQIVYTTICFLQNKRRDRKYGQQDASVQEESARSGFNDLTDKENKYFRYVL